MATIERRLDALETATDNDKLLLMFVSWTPSKAAPTRRLTTSWKGQEFTQEPDETAESFRARVRDAVNRNRISANCAAVVFLNEQDWSL